MNANAIGKMTQEEKLQAIEQLWDALLHDGNEPISPAWHEDILAQRSASIAESTATFISLSDLKADDKK